MGPVGREGGRASLILAVRDTACAMVVHGEDYTLPWSSSWPLKLVVPQWDGNDAAETRVIIRKCTQTSHSEVDENWILYYVLPLFNSLLPHSEITL